MDKQAQRTQQLLSPADFEILWGDYNDRFNAYHISSKNTCLLRREFRNLGGKWNHGIKAWIVLRNDYNDRAVKEMFDCNDLYVLAVKVNDKDLKSLEGNKKTVEKL